MSPLIILLGVFGCVAALVGGLAMVLLGRTNTDVENRLDMLTSGTSASAGRQETLNLVAGTLDETRGLAEQFFSQFVDIRKFLAQADMTLTPVQFVAISLGLAAAAVLVCSFSGVPILLAPVVAAAASVCPFLYVFVKRRRRISAFTRQLPDALELISRALRAGHSLAAGFNLVGDEMAEPIRTEFLRCYEEQNLGIPLEEALEGMTNRVPNLDLRFFATAVVLQRQTGGDLAEILDKIGHLVRERFKIWGQIQALTGEGRLSGIVLLALPPVLFVVMYRLNPDYTMVLFRDPIGQWLLGGAVIMQLLGAFVIKKIVSIKV
jgi:tight adherence protein B